MQALYVTISFAEADDCQLTQCNSVACIYFRGMAGRTFSKSLVLMCSPHSDRVPLGQERLNMYLNRHIIDGVDVPLNANLQQLKQFFKELFADQLGSAV